MTWKRNYEKQINSQVDRGVEVIRELVQFLESENWSVNDVFGVHMAFEEALMNAIKHGNNSDPEKTVQIKIRCNDESLYIQVTDQGSGFDPGDVPDCTREENLEKTSGRGLLLMKSFMDSVEYNSQGNSVEMTKNRQMIENASSS